MSCIWYWLIFHRQYKTLCISFFIFAWQVLILLMFFCFFFVNRSWPKHSTWQRQCLCSVCPKDLTPTVVDLTLIHPASLLCVVPLFPLLLHQRRMLSSCSESNMRDPHWGRVSSDVSSPWVARRFSFTCSRRWRWRPHLEHLTSTYLTSRCQTCKLQLGYKKRHW